MPVYLVTVSGELPLKSSRTRPKFYRKLVENISNALERHGIKLVEHKLLEAKVLVSTDSEALHVLSRVFGVYRAGRVLEYEFKSLEDLAKWVSENTRAVVSGRKFAVRVKRSGDHSFTSIDVAREIGALLKPYSAGVDLENPEVVVEVEVRGSKCYLYVESAKGPGGLPIGVEGSALVLFSGGFDSPVAAWLTAKRGVRVDFLHFYMGSARSTYYAFMVAKELASKWLYGYRPTFILVDFRDVVSELVKKVEWSYRQVVLRALMYYAGSRLAEKAGYDAIVTGESIGQASSQTLKNLKSAELAVNPAVPILRPLLGLDKEEIVELSRKIGLYELSARVAEACAVAPTRVVTSSTPEDVAKYLKDIDVSIVDKAVESAVVLDVLSSQPHEAIPRSDIELDFIPEGFLVVDARSSREKEIEGAIPLSSLDLARLPRDKPVIIVCDTGSVSYVLAKELRDKGYLAFSLRGGIKGCAR